MDGLTFYKIMLVLNSVFAGAKLNKITTAGGSIYFSFYKQGMVNFEYRMTPSPPVLKCINDIAGESVGALSVLSGATVIEIASFGYERAGYILLKKRKQSGKVMEYKAILEPAGNYANFLLLDGDGMILYSHSSRTIDPDRNIGAGSKYMTPKPNKKFSLDNIGTATSFNELSGFYPLTAKYADSMLEGSDMASVAEVIKQSLTQDENFYINESGKLVPFKFEGNTATATYENIGDYYQTKEVSNFVRTHENLKKIFTARKDKYERLVSKLKQELKDTAKYHDYRAEGDLLKSNLYKMNKCGEYELERYTDEGLEVVKYTLLQGETAQGKLEKLYKKASKLERAIPLITERMHEAEQLLLSAEEQLYFIDSADDNDSLAELERSIVSEKNVKHKDKKLSKKPFHEYVGEGYSLYAGRNSMSNHELVFRFAKDSDIWFHARNIPSSHILLRLEGGVQLTDELVVKAARVAAAFSKHKNEAKVDIDYTHRKYVIKPKNTPIGFVTYKRFKTITVEPFSADEVAEMFVDMKPQV